eukprot:m.96985 g.96985  ORF g.96985 m.96985 type:complete len:639 (-) comp22014_c0_seq1:116-2032(-)
MLLGVTLVSALVVAAAQFACDPLVPITCGLPFPNDFWRNATSGHLTLSPETLPVSTLNEKFVVDEWNALDGFSPIPAIQSYFPNLSLDNLPHFWNISRSLDNDCPTVLLDATTGERIPHWVELDHASDIDHPDGYERTLMMWPAYRLNDSTRYIVAMRGLVTNEGGPVETSAAFARLRDDVPSPDPAVEARRKHFDDSIFSVLASHGVERNTLDLAWDFTTSSTDMLTSRLLHMREDAFARVNQTDIDYVIVESQDFPQEHIARKLIGFMKVPWYLTCVLPTQNCRLNTSPDAPNKPEFVAYEEVQFTILIPYKPVVNGTTVGVMQYGHGLFGSQSEVNTGYLDAEADKYGYVIGAVDEIGLSYIDEVPVGYMMLTNLSNFPIIPDRLHQGVLNELLLTRLMTSDKFVNDPHVVFNGKSVIDPTKRYYYGNSQGGILGMVYMGITNDVERGVIGVGGGPFGLLLPRSADFDILYDILRPRYTKPQDRMLLLSVMQLLWDRCEPSGWLHHISDSPLPNTTSHRVIFHYGLGDAQVSWLGTMTAARSVGAKMYSSNVKEYNATLFGFPFVDDSTVLKEGNLALGFDFGVPPVPYVNVAPSKKYDTHEDTRRTSFAQEQTHQFLATGEIVNACKGPCKVPK